MNNIVNPPHSHRGTVVSGMMRTVCLAMVPGLLCYIGFFGWGILIQCMLAIGFALACEYLMLTLRKKPIDVFLKDGSAVVTALLFAFTVSPFAPWWITLFGIMFAIIVAKHLYGGLGFNLFNPAMAGFVFVLLCFPAQSNFWPGLAETSPGITDYLAMIFSGQPPSSSSLDAISGASPLNHMKSELGLMTMVSEIKTDPIYGALAGKGWEWINFAFLVSGIALIVIGIIHWHIPVAMLVALIAISLFFNLYDSEVYPGPFFHMFAGGTMLGVFFIATDPVTASTTPRGRLIYGAMIGILTYVIRVWGSYPDGIAFAILVSNAAVPFIDRFTRPKVLGEPLS